MFGRKSKNQKNLNTRKVLTNTNKKTGKDLLEMHIGITGLLGLFAILLLSLSASAENAGQATLAVGETAEFPQFSNLKITLLNASAGCQGTTCAIMDVQQSAKISVTYTAEDETIEQEINLHTSTEPEWNLRPINAKIMLVSASDKSATLRVEETAASCVAEGGSIPVIANPPVCCAGLELIPPKEANIVGSAGICTAKCGNGICDNASESAYNCPKDCSNTCSDGAIKYYTCPDGKEVFWCECRGQTWSCILSPEAQCGDSCTKYYICADGTQVKQCWKSESGCICISNPESQCPTPDKGFYISSVWTDKETYVIGEDNAAYIYAKVLDADNTPSTPAEGTTVRATITPIAYEKMGVTTSTGVEIIPIELIELRYNSESGYYEGKTNRPSRVGTHLVQATATNSNRQPSTTTKGIKIIVEQKTTKPIVVGLDEYFDLEIGQQANLVENGNTTMKIHFDSITKLNCEYADEAPTAASNATTSDMEAAYCGAYGRFSIATADGLNYSLNLRSGQSHEMGDYKITLRNLAYIGADNGWTATMVVQKTSDYVVYAKLDEPFWLAEMQTAIIEEAGLKMNLADIDYTIVCQGTGCPPSTAIAYFTVNVYPYKVRVSEGQAAEMGDFTVKFNASKMSDGANYGNFTVSKKDTPNPRIVRLDEKFELKINETVLVEGTGMKLNLRGIYPPVYIADNVVEAEAKTYSSTSVESVADTGQVEKIANEPIVIDSRNIAKILVTTPTICKTADDRDVESCTIGATEIWLRQGESRVVAGYKIHAAYVASNHVVLVVSKAYPDYIEVQLDEKFRLQKSQAAFVTGASLFIRLNSIEMYRCGPAESAEPNDSAMRCPGASFATISVWREKISAYTESEGEVSTDIAYNQIRIYPRKPISMYGHTIELLELNSDSAYFVVSRASNPNVINVHINDPFKLTENMIANVLEANMRIEALGISGEAVKFAVTNWIYTKEYTGKTVSPERISEAIIETATVEAEVAPVASAGRVMLSSEPVTADAMEIMPIPVPPMPYKVYTLYPGQSVEVGDYIIQLLEVNPETAVFIVKEKGYNQEISMKFYKGWNLFSMPGELSIVQTDCDSSQFRVVEYNPKTGQFHPVTNPKPGKAYWLYNAGQECKASGVLRKPVSIGDLDVIAKGWNFVAVVPEMIGQQINAMGNCNFRAAYVYNAESKNWESVMNRAITREMLGQGIAVYSTQACSLAGYDFVEPPMPPELEQKSTLDMTAVLEGASCGIGSAGNTEQCPDGYGCYVFREAGIEEPACIKKPVCSYVNCALGVCYIEESYPAQIKCVMT